ncbi:hypothetical protein RHMOL_Rhmol04G0196700 [Rhododendron molle]|uniref:Uncharacterized protein n=1 Tax=Rhododendron molle TaxID=49168 RepID=A0ACC0P251_RHOML|nr:hypothetical protein RHMOL_Rhmol04G0196700 [Rhododendron molle]
MEIETESEQAVTAIASPGAGVSKGGDGSLGQEQEVEGGSDRHAPEGHSHVSEETGAVEPIVKLMGSSTVVGDSVAVGGSLKTTGGSGAEGGDVGPSGSPLRDLARGKGIMTDEEETTEVSIEIRPEGSSSHRPITKEDVAEFLSDEGLVRLHKEYPAVRITVLKAKEDRARKIAASKAAARVERKRAEGEETLRDTVAHISSNWT